jgi:acyl-lipid (8-3)-desaturase
LTVDLWACLEACVPVQVAHVVEEVAMLDKDAKGVIPGSWAAQQMSTSADFCHGSWLWTHVSGGLNYQVIHHLFPGIIHTHYPAIAPIAMRVAKKHGVPYVVFPSFGAALKSHFGHLKAMGTRAVIPSLHTIG